MTFVQPSDSVMSQMLALRLHVDNSVAENGPLRVLPGTHRNGALSQQAIDQFKDTVDATELTVQRGGVVAMRPLLLHASAKSRTIENRRVLHFLFGPTLPPNELKWRQAV